MKLILAKERSWKRGRSIAALCAGTLALSGCGSLATDSGLSAAQVRFVAASASAPEMDFYVNGTGAAYGVGYQSFTSYLPVSPGTANLTVNRSGGKHPLATAEGVLSGGHQYTAIMTLVSGTLQERVYPDQDTPAPAGQLALRVLNEIEGAGSVSVYVVPAGAAATAAPSAVISVPFGAASTYVSVPATGAYTLSATVGERGLSIPVGNVTVKASSGAVRTVVFSGTAPVSGRGNVAGFALTDVDPS